MYTDRYEGDDILVAQWLITARTLSFADVPKAWLLMEDVSEPGNYHGVGCVTDFNTWGGKADRTDVYNNAERSNRIDDFDLDDWKLAS